MALYKFQERRHSDILLGRSSCAIHRGLGMKESDIMDEKDNSFEVTTKLSAFL